MFEEIDNDVDVGNGDGFMQYDEFQKFIYKQPFPLLSVNQASDLSTVQIIQGEWRSNVDEPFIH